MSKIDIDYTQRGRVQVVADGQVMDVPGMVRGGLEGDPKEPIHINAVLPNGETLRRRAELWAWNPRARAWVYLADDNTLEVQ